MTTSYHAKLWAHQLTRKSSGSDPDRLSMSLFDASVDLNPHQIDAAMFALSSPLSKGVILADEVGLGKTIEAGIVLCQYWAERKRKIIVVCPASIRKQWATELSEKFNLPSVVLDAKTYEEVRLQGSLKPFSQKGIIIVSYHFASRMKEELRLVPWDLVVIDEAHKLKNAYRPSNKIGQNIRWIFEERRKVLLTATPLQNSLLELYGLSTLIDEHIFGDPTAFRAQYMNAGSDLGGLRQRLNSFCKRTLRKQVAEYIPYTERRAITRPFTPTEDESKLYDAVSSFLQRGDTYAIPHRQRHLTVLILRKLLASSSHAIAGTLETLRDRIEKMRDNLYQDEDFAQRLIEQEEMEEDLLDEILEDEPAEEEKESDQVPPINLQKLNVEITELNRLAGWARRIGVDTKTQTLIKALEIGFEKMTEVGAARKALIFTESKRTQEYVKQYLEQHGYKGKIVLFNGTNSGEEAKTIYDAWVQKNQRTGRVTGSRGIDSRAALIEHFRDDATIMIATEAAAEGVNLQFCSMVINYDLPWNPQRIEQRIGRCHRYGQKHDVVVINFVNDKNDADRRVYQLLQQKLNLFDGVFGASDEVLGTIESGVDFEKRILAIYQDCRTPEAIEKAFNALQKELDDVISSRIDDTRKKLLEHFDEDVHQRLRLKLQDAREQLDVFSKRFWNTTKFVLSDRAKFEDNGFYFDLAAPPANDIAEGRYFLISKKTEGNAEHGAFLYRLSHPLGEYVLDAARDADTPFAELKFNLSSYPNKVTMLEQLKGKSGYLSFASYGVQSYEEEEYLLFAGIDAEGKDIDAEVLEKLFLCSAQINGNATLPEDARKRLAGETERKAKATLNKSLERNSQYFKEAREKLDKWADDLVLAAEKALEDTKEQIKALRRAARQAETLAEQQEILERQRQLEAKQRRQRQEIFAKEDEIMKRRDGLIDQLERRLSQKTELKTLFTIRWSVV